MSILIPLNIQGIVFDRKGSYSIGNEIGRDVIIFGVDMSLSTKIDNRK